MGMKVAQKLNDFPELGFRLFYRGSWSSVEITEIGFTFRDSINLKRLLVAFRGVGINIPDELVNPDFMDYDDLSVLSFIAYVRLYLEHLVTTRICI